MKLLAIMVLSLVAGLKGCPEAPSKVTDNSLLNPDLIVAQQAACERREGKWVTSSNGNSVCQTETGEGLKRCEGNDDCKGECLAASRTCAPVTPLLGCNKVINQGGLIATLCTE